MLKIKGIGDWEKMISLQKYMDIDKNYNKIVYTAFFMILLLKLALMGMFSSDYQNGMFVPFVEVWLDGGVNPYDYYYEYQLPSSFPYPPLMLAVESIGGMLLRWFASECVFIRNLVFKLPLLVFDTVGFVFMKKLSRGKIRYILLLYCMSPLVLYSTYMHGQLDIIPTVLLFVSVYFLMQHTGKRSLILFSVFLAFSICTKFHIFAAVPVLFLYLYKKQGLRISVYCGSITAGITALLVLPFWGEGFLNVVVMNREQSVITGVYLDYDTTRVFLPVLAVVLIYLKVYQLSNLNRELLLSILGVLFAVFLVCVPPMPGWFVWIVPYITIYFISGHGKKHKLLTLYAVFNLLYLCYFIFCHRTKDVDLYVLGSSLQGLKTANAVMKDLVFTVLAGCLLMIILEMYRSGITSNSFYKRMNLPFTIGIAGDSGTGKSELLTKLEHLLGGPDKILYLEGDGDHRWKRGDTNWERYTHLDPKANYLYRQAEDIRTLREGCSVRRADYDHDTGTFTKRKRIRPKPYIILCGLHSLYLPQTRKALDLKIYMDTDEALRRYWKIRRDMGKRGYSREEITAQIEKRIPDAVRYIYPQKEFADIQITYFDSTLKDGLEQGHEVVLGLKLSISISIDLEEMLVNLERYGVSAGQRHCRDLKHQEIVFDGKELENKIIDFQKIAEQTIPQYVELFADRIYWENGIDGILQLFILVLISTKMREG